MREKGEGANHNEQSEREEKDIEQEKRERRGRGKEGEEGERSRKGRPSNAPPFFLSLSLSRRQAFLNFLPSYFQDDCNRLAVIKARDSAESRASGDSQAEGRATEQQ